MSDRFATYPEMTESGDDLFCEIPASWDRLRIKQLFQIRKDIAGRLGHPVWSVTQHGLREKDITSGEGQLSMDYSKYQMLRVGDLVMNHMDLITGGVDIGWKEGVTSPDYRVFIPRLNAEVNKQFFVWLFRLCYWTKKFYSLGQGSAHLGRWRLPTRAFESIVVPVPTLEEQKQIAAFLDYETAKIDALIAMQQQLIALLGEKRQAVISHAVTKGLNPDAPMRDSGIEWLGEVPEHWTPCAMKHVCEVRDGTHDTPSYVDPSDDAVPLVTSKDFAGDEIDFANAKWISWEGHREIVKRSFTESRDVLMSMIGGNIGKALIVGKDADFSIKNVALFKTKNDLTLGKYILCYLQSGLLDIQISLLSRGGAQGFLGLGDIRNLVLPGAPSNEITNIVGYLEERLPKLDDLVERANDQTELLQERRTALISAAVTGKIDVRGWKPPSSAAKQETEMEVA